MNTRAARERRRQRIASKEHATRAPTPTPEWDNRLAAFPDPWLFDTQALLEALATCRETIWRIPMASHAVHLATQAAADQIWRLEQHLRFLLHLQREGQREFAKHSAKAVTSVLCPTKSTALKSSGSMLRKPNQNTMGNESVIIRPSIIPRASARSKSVIDSTTTTKFQPRSAKISQRPASRGKYSHGG